MRNIRQNNWVLLVDPEHPLAVDPVYEFLFGNRDEHCEAYPMPEGSQPEDLDALFSQLISIGDVVEAARPGLLGGTVVGVICNSLNEPVCYKVYVEDGVSSYYDYLSPRDIAFSEVWGKPLADILSPLGYDLIDTNDDQLNVGYFKHRETGEVILW